jgi:hypothetical protein
MSRFNHPLDNIRVASPCNADWDQMIGNDRSRFCGQCNLNVYNLSSMTRAEAELLIGRTEGRLCVRYYRRADGSVLTNDCPVGLRAIRRRMSYVARAVSSVVLSFFAGIGIFQIKSILDTNVAMMGAPSPSEIPPVVEEPSPSEIPAVVGEYAPSNFQVMGDIILPPHIERGK